MLGILTEFCPLVGPGVSKANSLNSCGRFATGTRWRACIRRKTAAGLPLKTLGVFSNGVNMPQGVGHGLLNGADDGIGRRSQTVMHPQPVPARKDEPGPSKIGQMP